MNYLRFLPTTTTIKDGVTYLGLNQLKGKDVEKERERRARKHKV